MTTSSLRHSPIRLLSCALLVAALALSGCKKRPVLEPLPAGQPAFPNLHPTALEMSVRLPGNAPWNLSLSRLEEGWRIEGPGPTDWADAAFVAHFLEVLSTFETVEQAGAGTDASFGFSPYRVSLTLHEADGTRTILFGDPTGGVGIYFKRAVHGALKGESSPTQAEKSVWIGRGSLIPFLSNLKDAGIFHLPLPYRGSARDVIGLVLTPSQPPGKDTTFVREGGDWKTTPARAAQVESLLHQRILRIAPDAKPTGEPDWRLNLTFAGGRSELIEIYFDLNHVWAVNPIRSTSPMELYPEFAGALRALTQARSTRVKSSTK